MIFLSCPYSSELPTKPSERVDDYLIVDTLLMRQGIHTVGALHKLFNQKILGDEEMDVTWEYWKEYTYELMDSCHELYVLCVDGWKTSKGVQDEIEHAQSNDQPIKYVELFFDKDKPEHYLNINEEIPK